MGIKRVLSLLLIFGIVITSLTGCANDAANSAQFVSDFQTDGKFMFHGLKYGISINQLLKKENLKKSDIKTFKADTSEWDTNQYYDFYVDIQEKLYGIDGKVRQVYYCSSKGYLGSEVYFYFDNEQKFLDGCEKVGKLLRNNFGDPYSVNDKKKYDKEQVWNCFMNPPKFSTWDKVEKYNHHHFGISAMPHFQWGDQSKEDVLNVFHSERLKPEKYSSYYYNYYYQTKNYSYNTLFKYYFIELSVLSKVV